MLPGHQYFLKQRHRRIADALNPLPEPGVVAPQKELGQLRDVVGPLAQRRHLDRDDVDPVVEILAESSFLHRLLEVDVGGGDQAELGLDRLGAADPLDLALLNGAQQLGLEVEPQIADLVEEQRAVRGQLELAQLLAMRAGERAALVAEERALRELARNRGEVDRDERRVGVARLPMDQPREQLLSGAALAENQHGRRQLGDLVDQVDDVARHPARTDDELALGLVGDLRRQRHAPAGSGPAARSRCARANAAGRSRSPW